MNEADTCRTYVVPKLQSAGWENPPFSIAERFVAHALHMARGKVAMLLPAVWLGGNKRSR